MYTPAQISVLTTIAMKRVLSNRSQKAQILIKGSDSENGRLAQNQAVEMARKAQR